MAEPEKPYIPVEEQFRIMADTAPVLIWIAGVDKLCYFFNAGWLKFTGRTMEQEYGNGWADGVHPDDLQRCLNIYISSFDARKEFKMEYRLRRYDGQYRWLLDKGVPRYTADGTFAGYIGSCVDIDELLETERLKNVFISAEVLKTEQTLNEELTATNEELGAANEELVAINEELRQSRESLAVLNNELDDKVAIRTKELAESEAEAQALNEELAATNEELAATNEELATINEELISTNDQLILSQQELQASLQKQARLAAIVSTSDDTILSKTTKGIITSWNAAAERMFGYTEAEALGKHISLIIPTSRLKEEEFIISQIISGNKVDHFETVRIAKDGREVFISLSVSPIIDSDGKIIGASKIARDISVQQSAQEAARRYTERLEIMNLIVETVSEELDLNKILQKVTDATTELTGAKFGAFFYNNTDEKGESFLLYTLSGAPKEAFEKFGMPRNTALFNTTFSGTGVVRVDDITKDARYGKNDPHYGMPKGHLPVVSYLAVPVISRSGSVIGGLFFGHPEPAKFTKDHESLVVSIAAQAAIGIDNAKLYEEVRALNDKKDEFIGLASHELKTPLTSISGYLQILSRIKTDEKSQKFVEKTLNQVQKLTSLVNDLLDVSKIEAGMLQLAIEEFDIREVIEDAIELIQHSNDRYKITFETDVDTCYIHGDSRRIEQVLINLLTNAIKYSPGTDRLEITLSNTATEVQVSVKDYGLGIAADKLTQVFSRFYRIEDANPTISGLGIGLYLSHEIITRHNGKLWAESEIGKGSTFYFSLPLV
jgi:PAS domain S-box-containing protein